MGLRDEIWQGIQAVIAIGGAILAVVFFILPDFRERLQERLGKNKASLLIALLLMVVVVMVIVIVIPNKIPPEAFIDQQLRVGVPADQYWYDTGITVERGDWLQLRAKGKWWNGISRTGPKGDGGIIGIGRPPCDECPVVDGNLGELVGKVDDEFPFRIGSSIIEVATKDGNLFLAMNDSTGSCDGGGAGSCYNDNKGFLQVTVTVWRIQ